jgi:Bacterial Ig-like domain
MAGSVAVACGGVDDGRINIVDEDGGSDGGGSGGNAGSAGSKSPGGGTAGTPPSAGGDGQGMAGTAPVPVLPEPPVVLSVSPDVGQSEVEPTDSIAIEFSEGLDPSTVTSDSVIIYDGETRIAGTLEYSGVTAEFTPERRLDLLGEYDIVVTTDITDAAGTPMAEDFSSSFTVRDGVWSKQLLVENATGTLNRRLVSPAIDGDGNVLVVWGQSKAGENFSSVFGRYFSPGEGFGEPFEIDQAQVACDDLSVGMNAEGEAVVAWTESHAGAEQVWARRLSQGELGPAPVRVDAVAANQISATVSAVSATGEAHILWSFNDSGVTKENILANRAPADGAFLPTPDIIYNYGDALSEPGVAFDSDGNGFVFFAFDADNTSATAGKLYSRRYLAASGQWGNGSPIDGSEGIDLYNPPAAVTDEEGGARAVFAGGEDVKVVTFSKAGGFGVAAPIDALNVSPSSVPKLASNGSQFLACWYQSASSTKNAYSALSDGGDFAAPELRSNGDLQVSYYGNAVCGLDRQSNGLVLFEQVNAAGTVDLAFGRLVGINGEWSDGSLINSLEGNYQDPRIAVAPNGIAVAAWSVGIRLSATSIFVSTFE